MSNNLVFLQQEILSAERFWKNYTIYWYNFSVEEEPSGNLLDWKENWYCYWDGSYDTPENEFVFKDPPKRWKDSRIIHLRPYKKIFQITIIFSSV